MEKKRTELFGSMNYKKHLQTAKVLDTLIRDEEKDANFLCNANERKRNKLLHRFIAAVQNPMSSCSKVWMNQKKNPCLSIIQMQIHAHSAALKPLNRIHSGLKTGNS